MDKVVAAAVRGRRGRLRPTTTGLIKVSLNKRWEDTLEGMC